MTGDVDPPPTARDAQPAGSRRWPAARGRVRVGAAVLVAAVALVAVVAVLAALQRPPSGVAQVEPGPVAGAASPAATPSAETTADGPASDGAALPAPPEAAAVELAPGVTAAGPSDTPLTEVRFGGVTLRAEGDRVVVTGVEQGAAVTHRLGPGQGVMLAAGNVRAGLDQVQRPPEGTTHVVLTSLAPLGAGELPTAEGGRRTVLAVPVLRLGGMDVAVIRYDQPVIDVLLDTTSWFLYVDAAGEVHDPSCPPDCALLPPDLVADVLTVVGLS